MKPTFIDWPDRRAERRNSVAPDARRSPAKYARARRRGKKASEDKMPIQEPNAQSLTHKLEIDRPRHKWRALALGTGVGRACRKCKLKCDSGQQGVPRTIRDRIVGEGPNFAPPLCDPTLCAGRVEKPG
jgi:hypothetical protein